MQRAEAPAGRGILFPPAASGTRGANGEARRYWRAVWIFSVSGNYAPDLLRFSLWGCQLFLTTWKRASFLSARARSPALALPATRVGDKTLKADQALCSSPPAPPRQDHPGVVGSVPETCPAFPSSPRRERASRALGFALRSGLLLISNLLCASAALLAH